MKYRTVASKRQKKKCHTVVRGFRDSPVNHRGPIIPFNYGNNISSRKSSHREASLLPPSDENLVAVTRRIIRKWGSKGWSRCRVDGANSNFLAAWSVLYTIRLSPLYHPSHYNYYSKVYRLSIGVEAVAWYIWFARAVKQDEKEREGEEREGRGERRAHFTFRSEIIR